MVQSQKEGRRAVAELVAGGRSIADDFVFSRSTGAPLAQTVVSQQFQRAIAAVNAERQRRAAAEGTMPTLLRRLRLYDCRHSAATLWIESGTPLAVVSEMLGHASIKLTADTYGHIRPVMLQNARARVAAFIGEGEPEAAA